MTSLVNIDLPDSEHQKKFLIENTTLIFPFGAVPDSKLMFILLRVPLINFKLNISNVVIQRFPTIFYWNDYRNLLVAIAFRHQLAGFYVL